jgi:hypothetical protein
MRHARRLAFGLVALALVASACSITFGTGSIGGSPSVSPSPVPSSSRRPPRVPTGPRSAAAAMQRLCVPPKTGSTTPVPPGTTPPAIAQVEHEVETVRGLTYEHPVAVQPVTPAQMDAKVAASFNGSYPAGFYARRTLAWRALGVIPAGADIRRSLLAFQTGEVVGFYNPDTGELVYIGNASLNDLAERFTLAHELTHAIDDQHFDLTRMDGIAAHCQDELGEAALGAVEGSAQYFASQVITRFPGGSVSSGGQGAASLSGVPPFIVGMELWPYTAGQAFITALDQRGGLAAVNQALRHWPVSTAQVMHPDRYPNDLPVPVNIPELAKTLGPGWRDLDVMQVGEEFLDQMLKLRMSDATASGATDGWGGGIYRAWTDGTHTAVVLATVWDSPGDATAFAQATQDWLDAGSTPGKILSATGTRVTVGFSSDSAALGALGTGLGSGT